MKIKHGVTLQGLKIQMKKVLDFAETIWLDFGHECVVTRGTEEPQDLASIPREDYKFIGAPGSLHIFGYALDLRNHYFNELDKKRVVTILKEKLAEASPAYRVVEKETHIHVEYRGFIYG
jgi:hypothetical protein